MQNQVSADQVTIASLQAQLATDAATIAADVAEEKAEAPPPPAINPASIRGLLGPKFTGKLVGHKELWFTAGGGHPKDATRSPGYNQLNSLDVDADCKAAKALGIDAFQFNTYAIGSNEDQALQIYLPATLTNGLEIMVDMDKAIWQGASTTTVQSVIQAYIDNRLRKNVFTQSNYAKWNGKYIVTFFSTGKGPDSAATWAALAKANPDIEFVANGPGMTPSFMSWGPGQATTYLSTLLAKYAYLKDTNLYMFGISPGFDDTYQGHSVWDSTVPPRVFPAGVGPNMNTMLERINAVKAALDGGAVIPWLQIITLNDYDEGTNCESYPGHQSKYFANQ